MRLTLSQAFIKSFSDDLPATLEQKDDQLTVLWAEVNTLQHRWSEAIKIVLNFRAGNHARRNARVASTMNRLVCPDIPSELRLPIVEAAVEPQIGHWKVTEDHDVHDLAASFFAWPDSVPHSTRDVLERTAASALLRKCIISIPISSKIGDQPQAFRIPPALKGYENRVSRLVVDIAIFVATTGGANREQDLAIGVRDMDVLAKAFPRLAVCTFLLHVVYHARVTHRDTGDGTDVTFEDFMLRFPQYRCQRGAGQDEGRRIWDRAPLEECLIDFIVAFTSRGPGRRKLIRFSRELYRPHGIGGMCLSLFCDCNRETRPLVSVSSPAILPAENTAEEDLSSEDKSLVFINAKRMLDKAYRGRWVSCWSPPPDLQS
jgi:hypothetical protein